MLLATNVFLPNTVIVHIHVWVDITALLVHINFLELQLCTLSQQSIP
jgi:hypothetical protein